MPAFTPLLSHVLEASARVVKEQKDIKTSRFERKK